MADLTPDLDMSAEFTDDVTITCLIPAWNEADRIGAVLTVIASHPSLTRIVVIDDGSTDQTAEIARGFGVELLQSPGNLGKTAALALGLAQVRTSHVLLLDADLLGLSAEDISRLIQPIRDRRADVSMSLRGNAPRTWRRIGIDYITGERILPLSLLSPHLETLPTLPRFSFEVVLNDLILAARASVAIVAWPDVSSPSKAVKKGLLAGLRGDIGMMADIFRTIGPVHCLRQIVLLRSAISG